jgi:pimeloyl-ACP methyl ester carboxylesterase
MSDPRDESVELASGRIALLRDGRGDPVVVLHHSTGNPGWTPFHAALARRFDVIVPDLPGFGRSPRPDWAREPRDLAILVSRALERLSLRDAALVGLGFGGFVAAWVAVQSPARLASLVLVGAAGLQPEQGEIADQMLVAHDDYVRMGFRDDATYERIIGTPSSELRHLWDHSREMTARIAWKPYMFDRRLAPLLADLRLPALLVWGEQDRIVPRTCGERYARLLPDARLEIVSGAGHLVELEEPERIAELVCAHIDKTPRPANPR